MRGFIPHTAPHSHHLFLIGHHQSLSHPQACGLSQSHRPGGSGTLRPNRTPRAKEESLPAIQASRALTAVCRTGQGPSPEPAAPAAGRDSPATPRSVCTIQPWRTQPVPPGPDSLRPAAQHPSVDRCSRHRGNEGQLPTPDLTTPSLLCAHEVPSCSLGVPRAS